MAHHKSALKRIRQDRKRKIYNRQNKRMVKDIVRQVREAKTYEEALQLFSKATSVLDRVAAKGILHKNNVARKKSNLSKFVKDLKAA